MLGKMLGIIKKPFKKDKTPCKYLSVAVSELDTTITKQNAQLDELEKDIIKQKGIVEDCEKEKNYRRGIQEKEYYEKLKLLQDSMEKDIEKLRENKLSLLHAEWTLQIYHAMANSTQVLRENLPTIEQVKTRLDEAKTCGDLVNNMHKLLCHGVVPSTGSSDVKGKSLVGKHCHIKLSSEAEMQEFIITDYNAEEDKHRIAYPDTGATKLDELMAWIELKKVAPESIKWNNEDKRDFDSYLKQPTA